MGRWSTIYFPREPFYNRTLVYAMLSIIVQLYNVYVNRTVTMWRIEIVVPRWTASPSWKLRSRHVATLIAKYIVRGRIKLHTIAKEYLEHFPTRKQLGQNRGWNCYFPLTENSRATSAVLIDAPFRQSYDDRDIPVSFPCNVIPVDPGDRYWISRSAIWCWTFSK